MGLHVGAYRGLASPLLAVGVQKSFAFGVFGVVAKYLQGTKSQATMKEIAVAGACGGIANSLILTPVDQIKIAQQIQKEKLSLSHTIRNLIRSHGLARGLYGGLPSVVAREIPVCI